MRRELCKDGDFTDDSQVVDREQRQKGAGVAGREQLVGIDVLQQPAVVERGRGQQTDLLDGVRHFVEPVLHFVDIAKAAAAQEVGTAPTNSLAYRLWPWLVLRVRWLDCRSTDVRLKVGDSEAITALPPAVLLSSDSRGFPEKESISVIKSVNTKDKQP
ncbi:hypothetical protein HK096_011240 [Nowakowskiella sp. JEL0078]|nr:hypothetical protein HK096_011240 [Nowakowskiella sp. JEL0078]